MGLAQSIEYYDPRSYYEESVYRLRCPSQTRTREEINREGLEIVKGAGLSIVSSSAVTLGLYFAIAPFWKYGPQVYILLAMVLAVIYFSSTAFSSRCGSQKPYTYIGKAAKLIIEAITVTMAVAIRYFLGYNICYPFILMGITMGLHVYPQVLRMAYDISMCDIVFGSLMQILGFMVARNIYTLTLFFVLCAYVIVYRYISYSPPEIPICTLENPKN